MLESNKKMKMIIREELNKLFYELYVKKMFLDDTQNKAKNK